MAGVAGFLRVGEVSAPTFRRLGSSFPYVWSYLALNQLDAVERLWVVGTPGGADVDAIQFNIGDPPAPGPVWRITLNDMLPAIAHPVAIRGDSQPQYAGKPVIVLDGSNLIPVLGTDGLTLNTTNSLIRSLVIQNFGGNGINLNQGSNHVEDCFIGVDPVGNTAAKNGGEGIYIESSNNVIGGDTPGTGNVIAGNGLSGIVIIGTDAGGNRIAGNLIGLGFAGGVPIANGDHGVEIRGGAIGTAVVNNAISGNTKNGILISSSFSTQVTANFIGTDRTGVAAVGNGEDGVLVQNGSQENYIGLGGSSPNIIAGNLGYGVHITGGSTSLNYVRNNYIGLAADGNTAIGNGIGAVAGRAGVFIEGAPNNVIGGNSANGDRNVISGNTAEGIAISGSTAVDNSVFGNLIGTDATGTVKRGNTTRGITVNGARNTAIGAQQAGWGNTISGNTREGIDILDATSTTVVNNFIGINVVGMMTLALGNGFDGILVEGTSISTVIGGAGGLTRNVISSNGGRGVNLLGGTQTTVQYNIIGLNPAANAVFGNGGSGIYISANSSGNIIGTGGFGNNSSGNGGYGIEVLGSNNQIDDNIFADSMNNLLRNVRGGKARDRGQNNTWGANNQYP
jgi:hypothetical protein